MIFFNPVDDIEYIQCSKSCACSYKLHSLQQYIHNLFITEHFYQMPMQVEHIDLCTLSAAFDTLDHGILLHRFENLFGISGAALGWIASYLHDRYQAVVIDGKHSDPVLLEHGVPQGSVLGPKKYTMYSKPPGAYHFYVDDTQLYISFKPKDGAAQTDSLELIER